MYESIPFIQIRYKSIVVYYQNVFGHRQMSAAMRNHIKNLKLMAKYTGLVTKSTKKRIRQCVDKFLQLCKKKKVFNPITQKIQTFKLTFITLTISDDTTMYKASEAYKKLLRPFIRWLREVKGIKLYLWKAELQQRGQIHYHITLNDFVRYDEIKETWNNLQFRHGMLDSYHAKYNSWHPNSTDIHAVHNIRDIAAYLIKYLSKDEQNTEDTKGKVWDCSTLIKKMKHYSSELSEVNKEVLDMLSEHKLCNVVKLEQCNIYKLKKHSVLQVLEEYQRLEFLKYVDSLLSGKPLFEKVKKSDSELIKEGLLAPF